MPLATITLTGRILHPDKTTPCVGTVLFTPGSGLLVSAGDGEVLAGATTPLALDDTGAFTIGLPPTDSAGTQPAPGTWNWTAHFELRDAVIPDFSFALPSSPSTVDIAAVIRVAPAPGTYLVVPGPQGAKGDKGDPGDVGGGALIASNNLSELTDPASARGHLGLGNVSNTADTNKPLSTAAQTALAAKADLVGGFVPTGQLPALAITDTYTVASQAAMLALTAQRGDIAVRSDTTPARTYILAADDPTQLGNWVQISFGALQSVNGQTGVVVLNAANVGALALASNLADVPDVPAARGHLGLGTAALANTGAFDTAGAATTAADAALASAKAYADALAALASGSPVRIDEDRITVENIALPTLGVWTIITSSAGTGSVPMICSTPAQPGDRILLFPSFMRTGTGFYIDIALLDADGNISIYAVTKTTTPGIEGNPLYYPEAGSFPAVTGPIFFTPDSTHIDTGGMAKYALVAKGSGSETLYGSGTYPLIVLALNFGPAPA